MKRWLCAWVVMVWLVCQPAWAYEVTDDTGHTVHFDAPPLRVVSLLPLSGGARTETLLALDVAAGTDQS